MIARRGRAPRPVWPALAVAVCALSACAPSARVDQATAGTNAVATALARPTPTPPLASPAAGTNVYASTISGELNPTVADIPPRVYVPNSSTNTVTVIDPLTMSVIKQLQVGRIPEHIAPAYDLSKLYIDSEGAWRLEVLDPRTSTVTDSIPVNDPYNLYFTPDGTKAIVVQENLRTLEFRDLSTWQVLGHVPMEVRGADHLDFSADGRYVLVTLEFTGVVAKVDITAMSVVGYLLIGGLPIDVRLSPDASVFFIANQGRNGVSVVDPVAMKELGFIPTGRGAHGLYISRDTRSLYVTNRLAGSISVIDIATRTVSATWHVGGSPDMMQLNPDGSQLWVSSRFDGRVMVVDTSTGTVLNSIYCGPGAHGLTYFPAPGLHSLGHNGVYR